MHTTAGTAYKSFRLSGPVSAGEVVPNLPANVVITKVTARYVGTAMHPEAFAWMAVLSTNPASGSTTRNGVEAAGGFGGHDAIAVTEHQLSGTPFTTDAATPRYASAVVEYAAADAATTNHPRTIEFHIFYHTTTQTTLALPTI